MQTMLVSTKLQPHYERQSHVQRTELHAKLEAGLVGKLTLITAPAGFGKTTLAAEWVQKKTAVWLALDAQDNDTAVFYHYLVAAMQTIWPERFGSLQNLLQLPLLPVVEVMVRAFVQETAVLPTQTILVFDDFHSITNETIHRFVQQLFDYLPESVHLLILSRAELPFPVSRLRVRGEMQALGLADLRFDLATSQKLLEGWLNRPITRETAVILHEKTEGWAVGLRLAALALNRAPQTSDDVMAAQAFRGLDQYVVDFLWEEILSEQSPEVQSFLLQTAVLDRFCADLCDTAVADLLTPSQPILNQLVTKNLFLTPLDNERRWFRYHPLFAEFLRHQFALSGRDGTPILRRAGQWFAVRSLWEEALHYFVRAQAWDEAEALLSQISLDMLMDGELLFLQRWLGHLPETAVFHSPTLSLTRAWLQMITGKIVEAENTLTRVAALVGEDSPLMAQYCVAQTTLQATLKHNEETILWAKKSLQRVAEEPRLQATVYWNLGFVYRLQGDFAQAIEAYRQAATLAESFGNVTTAIQGYTGMGNTAFTQSDWDVARWAYERALQIGTLPNGRFNLMTLDACISYAQLLRQQKKLGMAAEYGRIAIQMCQQIQHPDMGVAAYCVMTGIALDQGNQESAETWFNKAISLSRQYNITRYNDRIHALKAQFAQQNHDPNLQLIEPLSERELEVLRLVSVGYSNQEMAEQLVVALSTVKWHLRNIYEKLGVNKRTQAVAQAQNLGIL